MIFVEIFYDFGWFFATRIRICFIELDPDPADQNETDPNGSWSEKHCQKHPLSITNSHETTILSITRPTDSTEYWSLKKNSRRLGSRTLDPVWSKGDSLRSFIEASHMIKSIILHLYNESLCFMYRNNKKRQKNRGCFQFFGSVSFWYGSVSSDPFRGITNPAPDPT